MSETMQKETELWMGMGVGWIFKIFDEAAVIWGLKAILDLLHIFLSDL